MAVYKPIKVTSLPAAPLAENAVYFVKGTTDTRIKMYVTDTSGTAFLVGITSENEVLSTLLNGFTVGSNTTIASSDSILGAFGKTQGQINALATVVNEGIKVPVPINCSTNPNYPASTKGDSYLVTVAGKIGGASGIIVDVGDKIICLTTNAGGTQASVGSNFYILESNFNILSIAKGGTNSSTALNNNRVMVSSSGSILEATAITANRALISNASGIPVHSSVTNTELGHLSGVTSSIQTQLNGKEPSFTKNTGFNKNFGTTAGTVAEGNDSRFHNAVTLGTSNGLSLVGQGLSLSLSSTSTTGALSSTDWNTFNNKENVLTFSTGLSRTGNTVVNTITQYTDALARASLSFVAGSGAYNSTTGVITIPTNNNQITNGAGYITGNQTITLSGDVTGSGTTSITTTLSNSGVVAGTYNNVATQVRPFTVDAKGRITSIGTAVTITPAFSSITNTPTTLNGYGITDAYTQTQVNNLLNAYLPLTGGTVASSGSTNTLNINHTSGSGIALNITKGGNGEGIRVNKTSGSGNAATIIGTLEATTLVKSGGTASQYLMADGSVSTLTNPITGTATAGQVSFWNGTSTQTGNNTLTWDDSQKILTTNGGASFSAVRAFTNNVQAEMQGNEFSLLMYVGTRSNHSLVFRTNLIDRWSILTNGVFQSNGAQTIQTSTGDLTLQGTGLRTVFGARTRHTPITAPTTDLNAGDMYYDSATNRMRFRRTSDWVEMGMLWDTVEW
jgi:hypothetical protein